MGDVKKIELKAIKIKVKDNVGTVITDIAAGERVRVFLDDECVAEIPAEEAILTAHKIALRDIATGEEIFKYGESIGRATEDIPVGCHVHIHNIESLRGRKHIG